MVDTLRILTGEEEIAAAVRALSDESRRLILHALRARTMTTNEIRELLQEREPDREVKAQTVRYHLKELERAGLIEQQGYEPAGNGDSHIMQKCWRATAENIFIATCSFDGLPAGTTPDLERALDIGAIMKELGFRVPDTETVRTIADEFVECDRIYMRGREMAKRILSGLNECDPYLYMRLRRLLSLVTLNDTEYERYWALSRSVTDKLREAYRKGPGRNPPVY